MTGFEALFAGAGAGAAGGTAAAAGAGTAAAAGAGTAAAAGAGTAAAAGAGTAAAGTSAATYAAYAGAALSALSAYQTGQAGKAAANYNAAVSSAEAGARERAQREEAFRRLGSIRSQLGKSGATSAGTPLLVLADSAANAEIDALNTRYGGSLQSTLYGMQGRNARTAGTIGAGASLLSGYGATR